MVLDRKSPQPLWAAFSNLNVKKALSHVEVELVFYFKAIAPHPVAGHHWKEHGTILLIPAFEVFICIE